MWGLAGILRTLAFTLSEMGPWEGFSQSRGMIQLTF